MSCASAREHRVQTRSTRCAQASSDGSIERERERKRERESCIRNNVQTGGCWAKPGVASRFKAVPGNLRSVQAHGKKLQAGEMKYCKSQCHRLDFIPKWFLITLYASHHAIAFSCKPQNHSFLSCGPKLCSETERWAKRKSLRLHFSRIFKREVQTLARQHTERGCGVSKCMSSETEIRRGIQTVLASARATLCLTRADCAYLPASWRLLQVFCPIHLRSFSERQDPGI